MPNPVPPSFESIDFAGGGGRCFRHAGFWRDVQGPLCLGNGLSGLRLLTGVQLTWRAEGRPR
jgi:hypothetical protein